MAERQGLPAASRDSGWLGIHKSVPVKSLFLRLFW